MTATVNENLILIYELRKSNTAFYMTSLGALFWSFKNSIPKPLEEMPVKLQAPLLLKFIQNHHLAEKVKFIQDPLVCIELYVKATYFLSSDL